MFNAETDSDRPAIYSIIEHPKTGVSCRVEKVAAMTAGEYLAATDYCKRRLDSEGFDEILIREHSDRPFVLWLCWVKYT